MERMESNERDRWFGPKWLQDLLDRVYRTAPTSRWERLRRGDDNLYTRARDQNYEPRDGSISNEEWWEERARERQNARRDPEVPLPASDLEEAQRADAAAHLSDARSPEHMPRNE